MLEGFLTVAAVAATVICLFMMTEVDTVGGGLALGCMTLLVLTAALSFLAWLLG